MKTIAKTLLLVFITLCFTAGASAATFVVNTTNDTADIAPGNGVCADASSNCSLRAAISEANALFGNDIITLPAGTYTQTLVAANENNNAGGDWDIISTTDTTGLTINGAGSATTILQAAATPGTATERVIDAVSSFGGQVAINGVTIRHGNATASDGRGGGIANGLSSITITNSIITLNSASGGGGIYNTRNMTLTGVTVSSNACINTGSSCFGGGVYIFQNFTPPEVTITNSQIINNTATASGTDATAFGAGLANRSGPLTVTGSTFSGNQGIGTGTGGSVGAGLYFLGAPNCPNNLTDTAFTNNSGSGGSTVKGSGIAGVGNSASSFLTGTWNRITVDSNTGNTGSGILLENIGVGVLININSSTISDNTAALEGAGVLINGNAFAAQAGTTVNFLNTTISGNTAATSGGGVFVRNNSVQGGSFAVSFNYCTIANNTATSTAGGGIARTDGTVNVKNTVVAANTAPIAPDISGTVNSQDYNRVESIFGVIFTGTTTHDTFGPANLGVLQINGSGPRTQLPGAGSPLRDRIPGGANDCGSAVNVDERGITRPQGGLCDIGAVEVVFPAGPFTLSGAVKTSDGRPIRNVGVTITGGSLPPQGITVFTGSLGNYVVTGLPGAVYTVLVQSKKFTLSDQDQTVTLDVDTANVDFIADPEVTARPGIKR